MNEFYFIPLIEIFKCLNNKYTYIFKVFYFQILMPADFQWIPSSNGHVPPDAVEAGRTVEGEILFVGRAYQNGVPCVGKVCKSQINFIIQKIFINKIRIIYCNINRYIYINFLWK